MSAVGTQAEHAEDAMASSGMPASKTVIFVRHAESRWNRAQKTRNLALLLASMDAPITSMGYEQALTLQLALREVSGGGDESGTAAVLTELCRAERIWVSPLTRALQTALVALLPVYEGPSPVPASGSQRATEAARGMALRPIARERKSLFGIDGLGAARGKGCRERACKQLNSLPQKPSEQELAAMRSVDCDAHEAECVWWTRTCESRGRLRRRARMLLDELLRSDQTTLAVVSHSIFLKELFRTALTQSTGMSADERALVQMLCERKLPNCGVVSCQLSATGANGAAVMSNVRSWAPKAVQQPASHRPWRRTRSTKVAPI